MEKRIIYDNRSFILGTRKRYYYATIKGKNIALHRYVYQKFKGAIPAGWHVHHKDEDCFNNDITNLEALPPKKHSLMHRDVQIENGRKMQLIGKEYAKAWHSSEDGMKWHNEHYQQIKDRLHARQERQCTFCSKTHLASRKNSNSFCSNNCKSAWRRQNKPDKKNVTCPTCQAEFETLKYLPNTYCSRKCIPVPNPLGFHARTKP